MNEEMKMHRQVHNYGIDLLRVIGALFVILIHLVSPIKTIELSSAWIAQKTYISLVVTCINIFALISGYLCWNRKLCWKRVINLYITVLFYSVICTILATLFVEVPKSDFIYSFIPLLSSRYWYFSAYIGMCFMIPFMNLGIDKLSKDQGIKTILGFLFAFTILTFLKDGYRQGIGIMYGFSSLWLCVLYICGGIIAKFHLNDILSKHKWIIIALICWIATAGYVIICSLISNEEMREWVVTFLYRYSSPTVCIMSICLFMFFAIYK